MFAPPPKINSISICTSNFDEMVSFYFEFGILFNKSIDKKGQRYAKYIHDDFVFNIVETSEEESTKNIELNFVIDEIDGYLEDIKKYSCEIIKGPWSNETGRHLIIRDPDKHLVWLTQLAQQSHN